MNVLDTSIANVSIPAISGDLGVSPSQGTWVITSFAVANAISVPLTGWLTQRFGPVRLFVASILLFVIASWLCGLAPNIGMLIAFRVLQGFVAGPMIPLSQTLLLSSYPRAKAGTAMAMWAMTVLVAPVAGPLLGGWITDNISWPWIFYINIPVGLIAAAITWSIYRKRDPGPRKSPLDYVGLALLVIWIGALQIMIDKGKELDWFGSTQIVVLAAVAVGRLRLLPRLGADREAPDRRPAPVRAAQLPDWARSRSRSPTASSSATSSCCRSGCSSTWATPRPGPAWRRRRSASSPSSSRRGSARTSRKIDPRKLATVAFLGFGVVLVMRSHFNVQADFRTILIPTVLQGAAMAFFFIPLQAIIFSGLDARSHAGGGGPQQLRAHHRRRDRHLDLHDHLGEPRRRCTTRELAEAHQQRQQRGDGGARPARCERLRREPGARDGQPHDRPAGLHAGGQRPVLPFRRPVRRPAGRCVWLTQPAKNVAIDGAGAH